MMTIRTLFSGGELFGVGAQQAGYTHVDGYEIEPKIAAVAQLNGFDVRVADVCSVDYDALAPVNHLHASPSCKNASSANQKGVDDNGEPLPRETEQDLACADAVCRAIAAHQGDTFTLENVYGYRVFESFDRIRAALSVAGFSFEYWHLNAANYGVPQTRKRLILIARRGLWRIHRPHPTHREGGDMFYPAWIGWYAAIADLLDTLPPTEPARWQLARLPKELREATEGTFAIEGTSTSQEFGFTIRHREQPMWTLKADPKPSHMPKAYIVGGGNTQLGQIDSHARTEADPMFTVSASDGARKVAAAYLLDGDNTSHASGEPTLRRADQPAMTMRGTRTPAHRAYTAGRWVRMTVRALGRFQTVPDDYRSLTAEINGNGVPCELARQIMLTVRDR